MPFQHTRSGSTKTLAAVFGALLILRPGSDLLAQQTTETHDGGDSYASDEFHPHSGGVVFLGGTTETKRGKEHAETGFAAGFELFYRFAPMWSVSGVVEAVGRTNLVRDLMVIVPVSIWPWENLRFAAGPGYEFAEEHDEFVFRFGTGYEFIIGGVFIVAPEFFVDWIGFDKTTYVYGVAFGIHVGGH